MDDHASPWGRRAGWTARTTTVSTHHCRAILRNESARPALPRQPAFRAAPHESDITHIYERIDGEPRQPVAWGSVHTNCSLDGAHTENVHIGSRLSRLLYVSTRLRCSTSRKFRPHATARRSPVGLSSGDPDGAGLGARAVRVVSSWRGGQAAGRVEPANATSRPIERFSCFVRVRRGASRLVTRCLWRSPPLSVHLLG